MDTQIDIDTAFKFVFWDKEWIKKVLIGGLLYLTMVGMFPVMGWVLEIQRRVIREEEDLLPDWADIGIFTLDGLKLMLVSLIWTSPIMLLYLSMFFAPIFLIPILEEESVFFGLFPMFSFMSAPLSMLLMMIMYVFIPIISGLLADTNSIGEALRVSRVFQLLRVNYLQCLGAAFLGFCASYAVSLVGMMLCFVGTFLVAPVGMAITYHFFGQAYRNAVIKSSLEQSTSQE